MRTFLKTKLGASIAVAAAMAAATVSMPVAAQRLSLAERVAKLEADAQAGKGNVDLINQIQSLQTELQQLTGQVEQLRHQLDELKERNKQQYIDLDSRLGRLEGGGTGRPAAENSGQLEDIQLGNPNGASPEPARAADPMLDRDDAALDRPVDRPVTREPINADVPPEPPTRRIDPAGEKATYDEAFGALKEGRYAESAKKFQAFIDTYPNSDLTANAYYWLGESYYVTQNYRVSLETFQTLLKVYPDSQKAPDAMLKTGYCLYELKQWDSAEKTLTKVVQKYPDTTVARLAQGRLRALKLEGAR
ncbi:tol-pal system protein YbgF [Tahibacter amnicola]|uniref:Cell division coordinator CpoB n=1 Tax=Tahibacter amnicola TaxID=2976241 RepID=A0ABY6BCV9_9GAMM|nr:tol-pal system protein YbgF [Tahibacter amnicola]UXI67665.1 tol-pal system protein YbgF [Tahibacter amnicola]